jgi:hypothetical protein
MLEAETQEAEAEDESSALQLDAKKKGAQVFLRRPDFCDGLGIHNRALFML